MIPLLEVLLSVFVRWKVAINENVWITDHASRIFVRNSSKSALNQKNVNVVLICQHDTIINFYDVAFLSSSLVTGPSVMSVSLVVLEFWQFLFIRVWPEIWKSEIPPSEFCPKYLETGTSYGYQIWQECL